ncbi:MAG TPA: agmatine deiminase family protein [Gaiellales bacterium]|jgi:agmatine deiminase|nr:agmatine deiminase family protein [Gaiellales bacterium]
MAPNPRDDSLFVPSRTAEHARTFVSWPCREDLWGELLGEAEAEYAATVAAIAQHEPVTVIAPPGSEPRLPAGTAYPVDVAELPIDDSWVRDNGPIFVVDGRGGVAAVRFGFNAWGGKYAPFAVDAQLPARLAELLGMRVYDAPLVAEGGGLAFDGEGTLITTESVLLNPNRNPGLSREQVEELVGSYLGIEKVIWLRGGLVEDRDTDGHSDNVVQFVRPGVVLVQMAPDRSNPNWDVLRDNRARLEGETDAAGRRLEVVEMPVLPYVEVAGERFVVPYVNYYPVNGGIVAPELGEADDEIGFGLLRELFPDREVVGAPSRLLAYGGGGIGCITQQLPAGMALA